MYVYFGTTAHKNRAKDCIEMFLKVYRFQKLNQLIKVDLVIGWLGRRVWKE